jgi:F-type H+-transporting ATPase subunit gamma
VPFKAQEPAAVKASNDDKAKEQKAELTSPYSFEPNEEEILTMLLPKNVGVQMFRAVLDSAAGEQAARMTAMDNATRNAGDMIKKLTIQYNRARQAYITKDLIEIISGAEAV